MRLQIFALALVVGLSFGYGTVFSDNEANYYVSNATISSDSTYIRMNKDGSPDELRRLINNILDEFETWYPDVWRGPDSNGIKMYKVKVEMYQTDPKTIYVYGIRLDRVTQNESNKYRWGAK